MWTKTQRRLAALGALALLACGGGQPVKPQPKMNRFGRPMKIGTPVAVWVDRVPESTRERYVAVGFSKPTFWPQDAINNAAEDARGKLALSLASHIETLGHAAATARGEDALDLTKEATDLVVQNSRIEATWSDEEGTRDEIGSVWALAVIDLKPGGGALAADETNTKLGNKMPGWLDRLPNSSNRIYAAGYSGPTFSPDDSLQYAGDSAVQNLAASLRSHVQAYNLLIETRAGMSLEDFAHTDDPDAQFLELVRKSARVEQIWVDEQGARAGDPPGAVWALAGIDVGSQKGGYQTLENDALGPALDAQGNVPKNVDDSKSGPTLSEQAAAQAKAANAAAQAKAAAEKAALDAHNREVKKAVQDEQTEYRKETQVPALVPLNGGDQSEKK